MTFDPIPVFIMSEFTQGSLCPSPMKTLTIFQKTVTKSQ